MIVFGIQLNATAQTVYHPIDNSFGNYVETATLGYCAQGGDTIWISPERTKALKFRNLNGNEHQPIVIMNFEGQVRITDDQWAAINFENCRYVKLSGRGTNDSTFGFSIKGKVCGLAFTELSSNCEAENIHIHNSGFFGIYAKKDYGGNPPLPVPVFEQLCIHDCFIEEVTEGMYLGETKTPGMEFKNVSIYNNIVRNTKREAIQIANMVENVNIHHNTLMKAGLSNEFGQNNLLQVGDNSVAKVFNNLIVHAPGWGIISFGTGNNQFENNFIGSTKGVFIDNRKITSANDTIVIANNYFDQTNAEFIVKSLNEINFHSLARNRYSTNIPVFNSASHAKQYYLLEKNYMQNLEPVEFADTFSYQLTEKTKLIYGKIGADISVINEPDSRDFVNESRQIILRPEMLVDEVENGSLYSPSLLVDEQEMTPVLQLHPISLSWKPYWNMVHAPYGFYIDLGEPYHLTQIYLHDMHGVGKLLVQNGEPGLWSDLFVEPCNEFQQWKAHSVNITTRYLRLVVAESLSASVNEIMLFGWPDALHPNLKSSEFEVDKAYLDFEPSDFVKSVTWFPNPVSNKLTVSFANYSSECYQIEIVGLNGRNCYNKSLVNYSFPTITLETGFLEKGYYILKVSNSSGEVYSSTFYKREF